jgi:hypothetical protein
VYKSWLWQLHAQVVRISVPNDHHGCFRLFGLLILCCTVAAAAVVLSCRLHKHVKSRLLRDSPAGSQSGLRVATLQSPFAFKVTASLGDDSSSSSSSGSDAAAAPPPHTGLGVAATPSPSNHSKSTDNTDKTTSSSSGGGQGSSSNGSNVAAVLRPKGAVLEMPEGLDSEMFVEAIQSADDVKSVHPDRVVSITQGESNLMLPRFMKKCLTADQARAMRQVDQSNLWSRLHRAQQHTQCLLVHWNGTGTGLNDSYSCEQRAASVLRTAQMCPQPVTLGSFHVNALCGNFRRALSPGVQCHQGRGAQSASVCFHSPPPLRRF